MTPPPARIKGAVHIPAPPATCAKTSCRYYMHVGQPHVAVVPDLDIFVSVRLIENLIAEKRFLPSQLFFLGRFLGI